MIFDYSSISKLLSKYNRNIFLIIVYINKFTLNKTFGRINLDLKNKNKKMTNKKTIQAIVDFIVSAEKSIKNAKKLLKDVINENNITLDSKIDIDIKWLNSYNSEDSKIIEWVFTWHEMFWSDWNKYPVPVNYSSKSKLVQWDKLKLTIESSGKMLYKQILPIEREIKTGLVVKEKEKYQVISWWQTYDLLTAAVTHFKVNIWDKISILVPAWKEATFAAIEAIIPKED